MIEFPSNRARMRETPQMAVFHQPVRANLEHETTPFIRASYVLPKMGHLSLQATVYSSFKIQSFYE